MGILDTDPAFQQRIAHFKQHPLAVDEEALQVTRAQAGDAEARLDVIANRWRYLRKIARTHATDSTPLEDVLDIAVMALMDAIEAHRAGPFKPALHIKNAIWNAHYDAAPVSLTQDERKLHSRLRRMQRTLTSELGREPSVEELADGLGIPVAALSLISRMNAALHAVNLDDPLPDSDQTLGDRLGNDRSLIESWELLPPDEALPITGKLRREHRERHRRVAHLSTRLGAALSFDDKLLLRDNSSEALSLEDTGQRWGMSKQAIAQRWRRIADEIRGVATSLSVDEQTCRAGLERMLSGFESELEQDHGESDAASRPLSPDELKEFWNEPIRVPTRRPRRA